MRDFWPEKQLTRNVHFRRGVRGQCYGTAQPQHHSSCQQLRFQKRCSTERRREVSRDFTELNGKQIQKLNQPKRICSTPHTWQRTGEQLHRKQVPKACLSHVIPANFMLETGQTRWNYGGFLQTVHGGACSQRLLLPEPTLFLPLTPHFSVALAYAQRGQVVSWGPQHGLGFPCSTSSQHFGLLYTPVTGLQFRLVTFQFKCSSAWIHPESYRMLKCHMNAQKWVWGEMWGKGWCQESGCCFYNGEHALRNFQQPPARQHVSSCYLTVNSCGVS